jgi:hypothetical protein
MHDPSVRAPVLQEIVNQEIKLYEGIFPDVGTSGMEVTDLEAQGPTTKATCLISWPISGWTCELWGC